MAHGCSPVISGRERLAWPSKVAVVSYGHTMVHVRHDKPPHVLCNLKVTVAGPADVSRFAGDQARISTYHSTS